jgi:hypothetical protein
MIDNNKNVTSSNSIQHCQWFTKKAQTNFLKFKIYNVFNTKTHTYKQLDDQLLYHRFPIVRKYDQIQKPINQSKLFFFVSITTQKIFDFSKIYLIM